MPTIEPERPYSGIYRRYEETKWREGWVPGPVHQGQRVASPLRMKSA
jgi:hypothetical protein